MRHLFLTLVLSLGTALPALAHPGHIAGVAGHDHWIAGAAIGAAIAVGLWAALKGRRKAGRAAAPAQTDPASGEDARAAQQS